jgi:hypothetical protein
MIFCCMSVKTASGKMCTYLITGTRALDQYPLIEQGDMSPYYVLYVDFVLILTCYILLISLCSLELFIVWRINKHFYYYYYYYYYY